MRGDDAAQNSATRILWADQRSGHDERLGQPRFNDLGHLEIVPLQTLKSGTGNNRVTKAGGNEIRDRREGICLDHNIEANASRLRYSFELSSQQILFCWQYQRNIGERVEWYFRIHECSPATAEQKQILLRERLRFDIGMVKFVEAHCDIHAPFMEPVDEICGETLDHSH